MIRTHTSVLQDATNAYETAVAQLNALVDSGEKKGTISTHIDEINKAPKNEFIPVVNGKYDEYVKVVATRATAAKAIETLAEAKKYCESSKPLDETHIVTLVRRGHKREDLEKEQEADLKLIREFPFARYENELRTLLSKVDAQMTTLQAVLNAALLQKKQLEGKDTHYDRVPSFLPGSGTYYIREEELLRAKLVAELAASQEAEQAAAAAPKAVPPEVKEMAVEELQEELITFRAESSAVLLAPAPQSAAVSAVAKENPAKKPSPKPAKTPTPPGNYLESLIHGLRGGRKQAAVKPT